MDKIQMLIIGIVCIVLGFIFNMFAWSIAPVLSIIGVIFYLVGGILISIAIIIWVNSYTKRALKDTMKEAYVEGKSETDSLQILKTRYAKGEINKQEYEQMKKDLES